MSRLEIHEMEGLVGGGKWANAICGTATLSGVALTIGKRWIGAVTPWGAAVMAGIGVGCVAYWIYDCW